MLSIDEILQDENIRKIYHDTVLLCLFKNFCYKREKDSNYSKRIYKLICETSNIKTTTKAIMKNDFNVDLSDQESELMSLWIQANLRKDNSRRKIADNIKNELCNKQNGICSICGDKLSTDYSRIQVDHIIPFELVGDELKDNYQCLCEHCNKKKSSKIDYVLLKKLKIR